MGSYEETMEKVRALVAAHPPEPDPPDDGPAESRRFYWQMKEIAARMQMQLAASRRERAEADLRRQQDAAVDVSAVRYQPGGTRVSFAREGGPPSSGVLGRIEARLTAIERELADIRDRMATKAELEAVKADVRMAAEGYALLDPELKRIHARLTVLDERVERIDLRLTSVESRLTSLETRLTSLESRVASLESRMESLESRVAALEVRVDTIDARVGRLEHQ